MLVMDETGISSDDIFPYTYEEKGSKDVAIVVENKKIRHPIVVTLRGDGIVLPHRFRFNIKMTTKEERKGYSRNEYYTYFKIH